MSDTIDDGGPAFPVEIAVRDKGMTLREWFAGQAIIGITSCPESEWGQKDANAAVIVADALIAALKKPAS